MDIKRFIDSIFSNRFNLILFSIGAVGFLIDYIIKNNNLSIIYLLASLVVVIACLESTYKKTRYLSVLGLIGYISFPLALLYKIFFV